MSEAKKNNPVGSAENMSKSISKSEINQLPPIQWEGTVHLLEDIEAIKQAVEVLLQATHLGFDTETRPSFNKGEYHPPALVQLATADAVYLFRICKIDGLDPLIPLFESENILKTGIAIKEDVKELRRLTDFQPANFVDITTITAKLGYKNRGLRALAGLLMQGRVSKGAQVSNWARSKLDTKQIRYAATDAWISRELYIRAIDQTQRGEIAR